MGSASSGKSALRGSGTGECKAADNLAIVPAGRALVKPGTAKRRQPPRGHGGAAGRGGGRRAGGPTDQLALEADRLLVLHASGHEETRDALLMRTASAFAAWRTGRLPGAPDALCVLERRSRLLDRNTGGTDRRYAQSRVRSLRSGMGPALSGALVGRCRPAVRAERGTRLVCCFSQKRAHKEAATQAFQARHVRQAERPASASGRHRCCDRECCVQGRNGRTCNEQSFKHARARQ